MTRAPAIAPDAFARSMEFLAEAAAGGDPCDRLAALGRESRIFAIFRELFPTEFAALGADSLRREGETRAGVLEFATLVSERLFPLYVEGIEECGLGGIPYLEFFDHESEWSDLADLPSALQLALFLNPDDLEEPDVILDALGLTPGEMRRVPTPESPGALVYRLDAALATGPRVLRRLGSISLIPARETGTVFWDRSCMCGSCDTVEWSREHVDILTTQYREACELSDAIRTLSQWLDRGRPQRVAQAVRTWNRAVESERSRHVKPEVHAA